jgi:glycosyltransferase involved in cell wall biosynthesis
MKLVIATPFYPPQVGVLATYAAGIETALRMQGHEVIVVTFDTRLPTGIRHLIYALHIFKALRDAKTLIALDTWSVGIPATIAATVRGVPVVLRIGGDFLWEQYIERTGEMIRVSEFYKTRRSLSLRERCIRAVHTWLLRRSAHIFFNTNFLRDIWTGAYGIEESRSSVLENYYPSRVHTSTPQRKIFISANRAARYKNAALLRTAFAKVKSRHPEIELDTSVVTYDAQLRRLSECYASIIPSVSEVGSNIAIESVAHGKPFITTSDTGTKERLADCGLYIDTRSEKELEQAIEQMLDPRVYAQLADRAAQFAYVRTWDDIASDIIRAVQRV